LTASLNSATDTLNCYRDRAYANEFPIVVEDPDVGKLRTIAQVATGHYGGEQRILLESFLEMERRMVMFKVNVRHIVVKFISLPWEECVPCRAVPSLCVLYMAFA
jgi:hypothetical protein